MKKIGKWMREERKKKNKVPKKVVGAVKTE